MAYELRTMPVFTNVWRGVDAWVYNAECRRSGVSNATECWKMQAQRNMASIQGSSAERCAIRAPTLKLAQAACAANAACAGVVRDGGFTCCMPSAEAARRYNASTAISCR